MAKKLQIRWLKKPTHGSFTIYFPFVEGDMFGLTRDFISPGTFTIGYDWWFRTPATLNRQKSHYLEGFIHFRWCRISEPSVGIPRNQVRSSKEFCILLGDLLAKPHIWTVRIWIWCHKTLIVHLNCEVFQFFSEDWCIIWDANTPPRVTTRDLIFRLSHPDVKPSQPPRYSIAVHPVILGSQRVFLSKRWVFYLRIFWE